MSFSCFLPWLSISYPLRDLETSNLDAQLEDYVDADNSSPLPIDKPQEKVMHSDEMPELKTSTKHFILEMIASNKTIEQLACGALPKWHRKVC